MLGVAEAFKNEDAVGAIAGSNETTLNKCLVSDDSSLIVGADILTDDGMTSAFTVK